MDTTNDLSVTDLMIQKNSRVLTPELNTAVRITELDGLRGIAILLVLSFHYINNQLWNAQGTMAKWMCKATSFGWVGVDLFFVLSGFLIGSILIKNKGSKNYFSTFYIRRIVRIIPNYYLALVLFIIVCAIPFFQQNSFLTGKNELPWWSYFLMLHNIFMGKLNTMGNEAMSVTWSIGIEEQFYIIFPFILFFIKEKWLPFLLGLVIISASLIRMQFNTWVPTYVLLPSRMDAIAFGILVAYYNQRIDLAAFVQKNIIYFNLVLMLDLLVCGYLYWRYNDLFAIKHTLFALFFTICLLFALTRKQSKFAGFLRIKPLVWVGTISYSLYLFQYFILGLFHHFAGNRNGLIIANGRDVVVTIAAFIASLVFSWAVFKVLETPMVKFGKNYRY